jgi:hypothetical protein
MHFRVGGSLSVNVYLDIELNSNAYYILSFQSCLKKKTYHSLVCERTVTNFGILQFLLKLTSSNYDRHDF